MPKDKTRAKAKTKPEELSIKYVLGWKLEKDPRIDMWTNTYNRFDVHITLNKFGDHSWSFTVQLPLGSPTLGGTGKTENAARADLITNLRKSKKLLSSFLV
jgi:hypothetical protein